MSRTICAAFWIAVWSDAGAKAGSSGIALRTDGSLISYAVQINYLPQQLSALMHAEAIRINRRVLLQCSIGAPGLKQPFAQPQQNGALSALLPFVQNAANVYSPPSMTVRPCPPPYR